MSRRRKRSVTIAVLLAGVLLTIGLVRGDDEAPPISLDGTQPLPRLVGTDLMTGKRITTDQFAGKPLVINAWAEWCVPCRTEAPILKAFAAAHPDIAMLGIAADSQRQAAQQFNTKAGWTYPSLFDPNGQIAIMTLGITNYPRTIFVDSKGIIRGQWPAEVTAAQLADVAARLR